MVKRDPNNLSIWRTIKGSLGRYIAILSIIALGSGVFAGLCVASDAMVKTGDAYYREYCFSDFTAMSTLGFTDKDIEAAMQTDGVLDAEGAVSADILVVDKNGDRYALKAHSITERINCLNLIAGRWPQNGNECLLDANNCDRSLLNSELIIAEDNTEDTHELLTYDGYTVVGLVTSPYYLNEERGSTTLGTGMLTGFVYLPTDAFTVDYYTEIYVSLGSDTPEIYSEAYDALAESIEPELKESLKLRSEERYDEIISEAEEKISDGEQELADGREELEEAKLDGQQQLDDARTELNEARESLDDGWREYENGLAELDRQTASAEQELLDGQKQLNDAKAELEQAEADYEAGKAELEHSEQAYQGGFAEYEEGAAAYEESLTAFEEGLKQYEEGEKAYEEGAAQLAEGKETLDDSKVQLDDVKTQLETAETQLANMTAFQQRAQGYLASINGMGYSYGSVDQFASALTAAANYVGSTEGIRYQTVYQLSQAVLQVFGTTPEGLVGDAGQLTTIRKGLILTAINLAGISYNVSYTSFDAYRSELSAAITFISSAEYQSNMKLVENAGVVLNGYVSDYDGSTGVQGFLTDWNYYAAVQSGLASNFGCDADPDSIGAAIDTAWLQYEEGLAQYEAGLEEYEKNAALLEESRKELDAAKAEIGAGQAEMEAAAEQLAAAKAELDAGREVLDAGWDELNAGRAELDAGWQAYERSLQELNNGRTRLESETEDAKNALAGALQDLLEGEASYQDGLEEYEDGIQELEKEIADAEETIAENEQLLKDARADLAALEPATLYILNRDTNIGYACFKNDSQIIAGIAKVFPIFFFLVAALVCITTMTRMVEDDRTQIGVMKALGYGKAAISKKYLIYSGSASLLGCMIGLLLGMWVIPLVLWQAYSMIYEFGDILFYFDALLAVLCTLGYLCCSLGVTWVACRTELQDAPANLIRPKAPKAGKRIFLERIPFLWSHLSFLYKVSLRNVFRYKKRLFMMLLGIGGCTGLLLTGFGVQDSIQDFVNYQFDDISLYDGVVTFEEHMDEDAQQIFQEQCGSGVSGAVFLHISSVDLSGRGYISTANLVATDDDLTGFMDFHSDDESVDYPGAGACIISRGLSERLGYEVGDEISLRDPDLKELTLTVADVYDNYVDYYIYTVPESLVGWGNGEEINSAYVNYREGADPYETTADVAGADLVSYVSDTASQRERVNTMMSSLNYIVALIVVCAGALAFIVLYNLTNINISERIREIATLKVLGFYAGKTASYVFRENLILSTMGAFVGLLLGKLLHAYVMNQIKVDGVLFDVRILAMSYVMSFALTLVFAWAVNAVMYFKIKKINMTESLKSVE